MRLTLRTLLAYLNDVLTPAEGEELKHRIEESEFASTLVQRIRHVLRRLRLSAPKVDGRGVGFDPNSVAEYLDSTMAPERVADFEKVCLESDVHLAEVAAGYEILAKVLNEHAEVPAHLRAHIHALPDRQLAAAAHAAPHADNGKASAAVAAAVRTAEPQAPPLPVTRRLELKVPDYLKREEKPPSNAWLLVPVGLLALLGIAFFVPPLSQYNPLLKPTAEVAQNPPVDGDEGTKAIGKNAPDDEEAEAETEGAKNPGEDPADTKPAIAASDVTPERSETPEKEADDEASKPIEPEKVAPEKIDPEKIDPEQAVASNDDTMPPEPKPGEGSAKKPPAVPEEKPAPGPEPSAGAELGRYISDETVLASFNPKTKLWMRVPPRSLVMEAQQCVSLPVYRPQVGLSSGVQVTFVGEGSVMFAREKASEAPLLIVDYGRLLLHSNALQTASTSLYLNGLQGVLTLETPASIAAVEVYNYLPPGSDPLAKTDKPAHKVVVNLIGVAGECTWTQQGLEPISIPANSVQIIVDGEPARTRTRVETPLWIDAVNTDKLDRDSAKLVEPLLAMDRPLDIALEELLTHRRLDVRVHVARCLAFLGQYEPLIKQLADEQYKSYWMRTDGHLDTLRKQLARGGESAERIRADMAEARGEKDGYVMFRLLRGFSSQQLVKGDDDGPTSMGYDEQLVNLLGHPSLDMRVLAIDNLSRITGKTNLYNPVQTPEKSRSRIKAWQETLDKGGIRYTTEPSGLTEFKSLEIESEKPAEKGKGK
jgi:hypothetical protein